MVILGHGSGRKGFPVGTFAMEGPPVHSEHLIYLLQGLVFGLGKVEIDDGDPSCIQNGKNDVCSVADILDGRWSEFDDGKIANPVAVEDAVRDKTPNA